MATASLILAIFLGSAQFVTIDARDMDIGDFLRFMGNAANLNVVLHPAVQGKVNLMVREARWEQVLDMVLKTHGLAREIEGNIMRIAPTVALEAEAKQKPTAEQACLNAKPLETRTYFLSYAKAVDVAPIISKMLSVRGSVVAYPARNALIVSDVQHPEECSR